jgi:anti-sigma factor RsiW
MCSEGSFMNCAEVLEMFPLYLSRELDTARAAGVRAHLASCPACACELEQQAELDTRVRQGILAEELDTRSLDGRIRQQIASRSWRRRWVGVAAGIAVALVLTALVYRFAPGGRNVYAAAARDHGSEVTLHQHRSWVADRVSLEALAAREGVAPSAVFNLAPPGYHLDRAKFCRLAGSIFLHLVYANGTQEFSIFLRSRAPARPDGVRGMDFAAERVAAFRTSGLDAMIVTDQSSEVALSLARSAQAALSPLEL